MFKCFEKSFYDIEIKLSATNGTKKISSIRTHTHTHLILHTYIYLCTFLQQQAQSFLNTMFKDRLKKGVKVNERGRVKENVGKESEKK